MSFDIRGVGLALIAGAGLVLSSADCASKKIASNAGGTTSDVGIDTSVADSAIPDSLLDAIDPIDTGDNETAASDAGGDTAVDEGGVDAAEGGPPTPLGPGAELSCKSSGKNAWLTYGMTGFFAVNASIFTSVTAELTQNGTSNLGGSFEEVGDVDAGIPALHDGLPTFKGELAAFLVFEFGGPTTITYTDGVVYSGQVDMVTAHTGLDITESQYSYFIANIVVPSLTGNGVTSDDVSSCFAPIINDPTFAATIIGH